VHKLCLRQQVAPLVFTEEGNPFGAGQEEKMHIRSLVLTAVLLVASTMGLGADLAADPVSQSLIRITDTITLPPGGLVLFWADDSPEQGIYHTNFALAPKLKPK
jgi:hypothetical protein